MSVDFQPVSLAWARVACKLASQICGRPEDEFLVMEADDVLRAARAVHQGALPDPGDVAADIVANSTDPEHMRVRIEAELRRLAPLSGMFADDPMWPEYKQAVQSNSDSYTSGAVRLTLPQPDLARLILKNYVELAADSGNALYVCAQMYEGQWYAPKWGCDTLQHVIDSMLVTLPQQEIGGRPQFGSAAGRITMSPDFDEPLELVAPPQPDVVGLFKDVATSAVEFEDERISYVSVQVSRDTWRAIKAWAAAKVLQATEFQSD